MITSLTVSCPNCGGTVCKDEKICKYCLSPILISSFSSVKDMGLPQLNKYIVSYTKQAGENTEVDFSGAIGLCQLKLKLYDRALKNFEKASETDYLNAEHYFYAAVCMLEGKKPFVLPRTTINKIEENIKAAIQLDPKPIYYLLYAYIRYDHHFRKFYSVTPSYNELLSEADKLGLPAGDFGALAEMLGVGFSPEFIQ